LRIIALIFIPIVLLFCCALIMLWAPLPGPFPEPLSKGRNLTAAILTGLLGMGYIVGLTVYVVTSALRTGHVLDGWAAAHDLTAQNYMIFGRRYRGALDGRAVTIEFVPARVPGPPLLDVYLETNAPARAAIGRQQPLLDCRQCPRVPVDDPSLAGVGIWSDDETFARRLLADASGKDALIDIMAQGGAGFRELYIQPERLWLRAHPRQLNDEIFQLWFDALTTLSQSIERKAHLGSNQ